MKLLHVSDWHLGREFYRVSRAADHDAVIAEIVELAREHRPDVIVHSGDLFDFARPAVEDMQRAIAWLQELAAIAPVAVLAGNHDSPALFALFSQLLTPTMHSTHGGVSRLRFVDKARKGTEGVLHYPATGPRGDIQEIRLAPLPFVRDGRIVDTMEDPVTWMTSYAERIRAIEAGLGLQLAEGFDPNRHINVFAAHLYVAGATWSKSERPLHVSDAYACTLESIPPVSYAAFGHIHKPQPLPSSAVTGAYAGSPIQLDFGEEGEQKRVVLVEAQPGRPAAVHSIPLNAGRCLRSFDGTLDQLAAVAPGWGNALTRVLIRTDTTMPDLAEQVKAMLPNATLIDVLESAADTKVEPLTDEHSNADAEPSITELYMTFLTEYGTRGASATKVGQRFAALLAAAEAEEPPPASEEALLDRLTELVAQVDAVAEPGMASTPKISDTAAGGAR